MASMYLALGYLCNHRCFFCPCGEKNGLTPFGEKAQLLHAIDMGIRDRGIDHITLSGGEPTLHPDFHHILKYCVDHGLQVSVLSNGDSLADKDRTAALFEDVDPRSVSVTTAIHSDLPSIHERVTDVPGSFPRTVQGLLNLVHLGIPVTVKQVISRWNYDRLPDFVDFVYKSYGPFVSLTLCGMDFCGMTEEQIARIAVDYPTMGSSLERALDFVISLRQQFGAFPQVTVADLPLCSVDPFYWGFFTNVSRSCLSQYSAPERKTGAVNLHTEVENDCNIYFRACEGCCVADQCPGVWHSAYRYFGESVAKRILPYVEE